MATEIFKSGIEAPKNPDMGSIMNEFKDPTIPNYIKSVLPKLGIKKSNEATILWKAGNIFIQIPGIGNISVDKGVHYSVKGNTIEFTPIGIEFMKGELKLLKQDQLYKGIQQRGTKVAIEDLKGDIEEANATA